MKNRIELLDHTGDTGLKIWGGTMEDIFILAARGMFSVIYDVGKVAPRQSRSVELKAESDSELFVRWLNHLNFLFATENLLFCRFDLFEIKNHFLTATVSGEEFSAAKHEIFSEIKAVTYHQLKLEQIKDGWYAQVVFDV
ncbi:MAG TPA: archease [Bacteroidetes bacterium]|nr:archease [Bacteroidota bacterium]